MMVTFVSQCEKNALKKTRRVLDAFADRIGDDTWQTVITEEGLKTVKKMLCQTASKSTAVSCHWIRSRSRSQFLWVVGNKNKFNESGLVPVNSTYSQVVIGDNSIMLDQIYANTKGQRLDQHLFAVGYLAYLILKRLLPTDDNLANAAFIAGCWHDIGKIDNKFRLWLSNKLEKKNFDDVPEEGQHIDKKSGKSSWEVYPRHNEISLLLFHLLFRKDDIQDATMYSRIEHAIYWHHAKPLRQEKNKITKLIGIFNKLENLEHDYAQFIHTVSIVLNSIKSIASDYGSLTVANELHITKFADIEENLEREKLPEYKQYSEKESLYKYQNNIRYNAANNLVRSALITADRLVSQKLTGDALNERINNCTLNEIIDEAFHKDRGLKQNIKRCLDWFNKNSPEIERNIEQSNAANKLADKEVKIGVLRGPAGCGKTKIALEWALLTETKKIFWICPRVQICEGLFHDLQGKEYLPNAKLEICTGENKQLVQAGEVINTPEGYEFSGDIVITTIDQIVNSITTHRNVTTLMDFMNSHVIFDEYHEYINMPGFNLLFAELVECKKRQQDEEKTLPNTLLVSATPNPLFIEKFLDLSKNDVLGIKSFNRSRYKIELVNYDDTKIDDSNPLYKTQPHNTFVISNTAITAQRSFISNQNNENSILLHSKFTRTDRNDLFEKVFTAFGKNGDRGYDILRSGPIIQASLNISCNRLISEMTYAENCLQRLGRLDRFGQNKEINCFIIAITDGVREGKQKDESSRFLNKLRGLQSAKAWFEFLQSNEKEGPLTIDEIYQYYDDFYQCEKSCGLVEQDFIASLKDSVQRISKIADPVTFPNFKKERGTLKIKKYSLRGDNRFVQMAICNIVNNNIEYVDAYAYEESNNDECLTYGVDVICGHNKSEQNLLSFMARKHHNIKGGIKAYNDSQLLNAARNPETPVYLSYIPIDLKKVEAEPHLYAIYYAIGNKQPLGAISLKQLHYIGE